MIQAIASVLGYIIRFFYDLVGQNYFITILLFTLFTKVVLFPLAWIQIKSMEKMNKMSVKQKEIQDKYKNDKQPIRHRKETIHKRNADRRCHMCYIIIIVDKYSRHDKLSKHLLQWSQSQRTFHVNFNIIIQKSNDSKSQCHKQNRNQFRISSYVEQRRKKDRHQDDQTSHRRSSRFFQMRLRSVISDKLSKL